jgi:hypothetical protein
MTKKVDGWIIVVIVVLAALLIANLFVSGTIFSSLSTLSNSDVQLGPTTVFAFPSFPIFSFSGPRTPLECNTQGQFQSEPSVFEGQGHSFSTQRPGSTTSAWEAEQECRQNLKDHLDLYLKSQVMCDPPIDACEIDECLLDISDHQITNYQQRRISIDSDTLSFECTGTVTAKYGCTNCLGVP